MSVVSASRTQRREKSSSNTHKTTHVCICNNERFLRIFFYICSFLVNEFFITYFCNRFAALLL